MSESFADRIPESVRRELESRPEQIQIPDPDENEELAENLDPAAENLDPHRETFGSEALDQ